MRSWLAILLALAAASTGCGPQGQSVSMRRPPQPVNQVDRIELFSSIAAINFDSEPTPDGIQVRVLLYQLSQPHPVLVRGTLDFLLFEGKISAAEFSASRPFRRWRFDAEILPRYLARSIVGWGYAMELRWPERAPRAGRITLVARYESPQGRIVHSDLLVVSMGGKQKQR